MDEMDEKECPETFLSAKSSLLFVTKTFTHQTSCHSHNSNTSQTSLPLIIIPNFQDAIIVISSHLSLSRQQQLIYTN